MYFSQINSYNLVLQNLTRGKRELLLSLVEGRKIQMELSASDANVSILSSNSWQPIIAKPPAEGWVFKHIRCSNSSNGTCILVEVSDIEHERILRFASLAESSNSIFRPYTTLQWIMEEIKMCPKGEVAQSTKWAFSQNKLWHNNNNCVYIVTR